MTDIGIYLIFYSFSLTELIIKDDAFLGLMKLAFDLCPCNNCASFCLFSSIWKVFWSIYHISSTHSLHNVVWNIAKYQAFFIFYLFFFYSRQNLLEKLDLNFIIIYSKSSKILHVRHFLCRELLLSFSNRERNKITFYCYQL